MFKKRDVTAEACSKPGIKNGNKSDNILALWTYLQNSVLDKDGTPDIKWNFTKFLVDRNGNVVFRSQFRDDPATFDLTIKNLLTP